MLTDSTVVLLMTKIPSMLKPTESLDRRFSNIISYNGKQTDTDSTKIFLLLHWIHIQTENKCYSRSLSLLCK
jgi:hypothetical protein